MSVMGAFSRSQIGEGGAENNRFASKAPNALTFFLNDGFIEKVRLLVRPPKVTIHQGITSGCLLGPADNYGKAAVKIVPPRPRIP
jgi:hypothetical protein